LQRRLNAGISRIYLILHVGQVLDELVLLAQIGAGFEDVG